MSTRPPLSPRSGLFEFLRTPFRAKNAAQAFQWADGHHLSGSFLRFRLLGWHFGCKMKQGRAPEPSLTDVPPAPSCRPHPQPGEVSLHGKPSAPFPWPRCHHAHGISPTADSVKAITYFPCPTTIQQLMSFVGMVNFYKRFIPQAARIMAPLHEVMARAQTKAAMRKTVAWMPERESAFHNTKTALAKATNLLHFTPAAPLALTTDTSDFAVGGVMEQLVNGRWRPLGFYSSKFRPTQRERKHPLLLEDHQQSVTERELLAAYRAIQHFRYLLEGRDFTLFTDHAPLVGMMTKAADTRSAMQARHLATISEFTTDVRHLSGKSNVVADALSRIEIDAVSVGLDLTDLATAQRNNPDFIAVRTAIIGLHARRKGCGRGHPPRGHLPNHILAMDSHDLATMDLRPSTVVLGIHPRLGLKAFVHPRRSSVSDRGTASSSSSSLWGEMARMSLGPKSMDTRHHCLRNPQFQTGWLSDIHVDNSKAALTACIHDATWIQQHTSSLRCSSFFTVQPRRKFPLWLVRSSRTDGTGIHPRLGLEIWHPGDQPLRQGASVHLDPSGVKSALDTQNEAAPWSTAYQPTSPTGYSSDYRVNWREALTAGFHNFNLGDQRRLPWVLLAIRAATKPKTSNVLQPNWCTGTC